MGLEFDKQIVTSEWKHLFSTFSETVLILSKGTPQLFEIHAVIIVGISLMELVIAVWVGCVWQHLISESARIIPCINIPVPLRAIQFVRLTVIILEIIFNFSKRHHLRELIIQKQKV